MKKRKKKGGGEKKYPVVGRDDLRTLPVTPRRRIACEVIRIGVANQIANQLELERTKAELVASRTREANEFYANVKKQVAALARR